MNLEYVPLVRVMREIQSIPRGQPPDFNGMKRFRHFRPQDLSPQEKRRDRRERGLSDSAPRD